MTKVYIQKSNKSDKRLKAIFPNSTTHFGAKGGSTYIDHNNDSTKKAWEARHKVREDWKDYKTAGALSKHVLWNKKTLQKNIADLNKSQNKYHFINKV